MVVILCYIFLFVIGFWLLYPYRVLEYHKLPLPLLKHELKIGEPVSVVHDFCKFMDIEVRVETEIQNTVIFGLGSGRGKTMKGCYKRISKSIVVPPTFIVGEHARIHYALFYQVNPIRTITYDLYSEEFTIVK